MVGGLGRRAANDSGADAPAYHPAMRKLLMMAPLLATFLSPCALATTLRDGDIIFHTSRSAQSSHPARHTLALQSRGTDSVPRRQTLRAHDALGIELGLRQKLREFDLSDPAVKTKMHERYGKRVPLDEPVISPAAQFESPLLENVETR